MKKTLIILASLLAGISLHSQEQKEPVDPTFDERVQANIDQWRDLKLGMFIHWGTYSQIGVVESWSLCPEGEDFQKRPDGMNYFEYFNFYENLQRVFNPVNFDPSKWAEAAKYAGMKYLVFTTKHHDGFNMFGTHQNDYSIIDPKCPYSKNPHSNIAKELFEAFRKEGLKTGAYYSITDWHSDDFWWREFPPKDRYVNYDPQKYPEKWKRYNEFMINQLDEITNGDYGDIFLLWFDLIDTSMEYKATVDWPGIAGKVRANRPGIMLVARYARNCYENYKTPEQTVPEKALNEPWESCITSHRDSWSYHPGEPFKSTREILDLFVKIVSRGGNLLLNFGPKPDGTLPEEAYDRLRGMGDWMKINSEGIYDSHAVEPYQDDKVYYTQVGDYVYAYYMADPDEQGVPEKIEVKSFVPVGGDVTLLGYKGNVKWTKSGDGITVTVPSSFRKNPACDHIWGVRIKVK